MMKFFERLLDERIELLRRIKALEFFIKIAPKYKWLSDFQKSALMKQLEIMKEYLNILDARVEDIEKEYDIKNDD